MHKPINLFCFSTSVRECSVMPTKYCPCHTMFLRPLAIREGHVMSCAKEDEAVVLQATFWLKQWKVLGEFLSPFLPCCEVWQCFRRLSPQQSGFVSDCIEQSPSPWSHRINFCGPYVRINLVCPNAFSILSLSFPYCFVPCIKPPEGSNALLLFCTTIFFLVGTTAFRK